MINRVPGFPPRSLGLSRPRSPRDEIVKTLTFAWKKKEKNIRSRRDLRGVPPLRLIFPDRVIEFTRMSFIRWRWLITVLVSLRSAASLYADDECQCLRKKKKKKEKFLHACIVSLRFCDVQCDWTRNVGQKLFLAKFVKSIPLVGSPPISLRSTLFSGFKNADFLLLCVLPNVLRD